MEERTETPIIAAANSNLTGAVLPIPYLQWRPAIAGGVIAAACFFVLLTFATAIGLAVTSASPTWRDTSVGLVVLSGAWIVLTAIGSFALGGYIVGRARTSWLTTGDEVHFRDGLHGLLVWGIAVIVGVGLAWASAASINQSPINTAERPSSNMPGLNAARPTFLAFEIDRLFRSDNRQTPNAETRAEAARIIETALGRRQMAADDHEYLVRLVSAQTGLTVPDADRRVAQMVAESRTAAERARQSAVVLAFTLASALAAAAAAAWGAALIGGRHRDENIAPSMRFSWGRRNHRAA